VSEGSEILRVSELRVGFSVGMGMGNGLELEPDGLIEASRLGSRLCLSPMSIAV
jgi:hypothetical protein